ncbi:hypothetical protein OF83DRAFT_1132527 [Amylostereum chailletii]|nr:hypothetical protein OF83DRAFT_1132527 [Amylostereum chailletii]
MMGGPTQPLPPPVPPRSGFSWLVVSGNSTAANTAIGVDGTPSPDAPAPLIPAHPSRLACPVEDCDSTVKGSQSGGWSRHILETHHGGEGLWVCRCGRCFKTEHNRNVHRDACKPNTSGWEAWDRRIKQIHKTTSASLLEEYQTAHVTEGEEAWVRGEWRKLGIAGVILSVHASNPFRCRPRRRYEDQIKKLKAAGMWEKDQYTVQQNVNRLYQHVERLRADGGV